MSIQRLIYGFALTGLAGCLPDKEVPPPPPPPVVEEPEPEVVVPMGDDPVPEEAFVPGEEVAPLTIDKEAEVAVLCYHDFTEGASSGEMEMSMGQFREQMEGLREAEIPVISMGDYLAWRRGEVDIPKRCVVITIDDGWKAVHRLALPVLKEYGYPFTVFLYSKYVAGGGKALTVAEIKELMANGGTIGSHSTSHPSPARVRAAAKKGGEEYDTFIEREMAASKRFLEEKFGVPVTIYAYPGGGFTERMVELNEEKGWYEGMFTINPKRGKWDADAARLPRFVVHAENDANFRLATTFSGSGASALDAGLLAARGDERAAVTISPEDGAVTVERRPLITADLSGIEGVIAESVTMTVDGFGQVDAAYDPASGVVQWQPRRAIRERECGVTVRFEQEGGEGTEVLGWEFGIDLEAAYVVEAPGD